MIIKYILYALVLIFIVVLFIHNALEEKKLIDEENEKRNRKYSKSINLDLSNVKVSDVSGEYEKPDISISVAHSMAKSFDEPKEKSKISMSYFTLEHENIKGELLSFQSPLIDMSKEALLMTLLVQKETKVHYDFKDPSQYWIDIDFLK